MYLWQKYCSCDAESSLHPVRWGTISNCPTDDAWVSPSFRPGSLSYTDKVFTLLHCKLSYCPHAPKASPHAVRSLIPWANTFLVPQLQNLILGQAICLCPSLVIVLPPASEPRYTLPFCSPLSSLPATMQFSMPLHPEKLQHPTLGLWKFRPNIGVWISLFRIEWNRKEEEEEAKENTKKF